MTDQVNSSSSHDADAPALRDALTCSLTDHLLIRACQAGEAQHPEKLHGLVPPPPAGKAYTPSILVTWAHKLVERRYVKPFRLRRSGTRDLSDSLFAFALRGLGFLGSWGVPAASALAGLTAGLAFLPVRIFTSTEVTLPQILFPVLLGALFLLWQVVSLSACLVQPLLGRGASRGPGSASDDGFGTHMLAVARRALPPYLRWNMNLGWCTFWLVVLVSTSMEYIAHHSTDRDYVYHSEYLALRERLVWLHRLSAPMPPAFRLPDDALAWGDRDYRRDGFTLPEREQPSSLTYHADTTWLRGRDKVTVVYACGPDEHTAAVIFVGDELTVDRSPPFEYATTAARLAAAPPRAIAIHPQGNAPDVDISGNGNRLSIRPQTRRSQSLTCLADGIAVMTNGTEYSAAANALPRTLEFRQIGTPESPPPALYALEPLPAPPALARLTAPPGYARDWFWFLFGIILIYGLAPRLAALPIFGLLYIRCKWRLYRELSRPPYTAILDELNQRPRAAAITEAPRYHDRPAHAAAPSRDERLLPHKDLLAVAYGIRTTPHDVRKYGGASDFALFERTAGDAQTNAQVMAWLDRYESFGRLLLCVKLTMTPDRPLLRFLTDIVARGVPCEIAFIDTPPDAGPTDDTTRVRLDVWRRVLEEANMGDLLPLQLREPRTKGPSHGN